MARDPDGIGRSRRDAEGRRLAAAGALSLGLHVLVLVLPAGAVQYRGRELPQASRVQAEQLTVSLAPPAAHVTDISVPAPAEPRVSGALMVPGVHVLQEGSRAGAPEPQPGRRPPLMVLPDLEYRSALELTRRPEAIGAIPLETQEIRFRKETGSLILVLKIGRNGIVDSVDIERSELPPLYAQTARRAFAQTRFRPGEIEGLTVRSVMRVEVTYVPLMVPVVTDADAAAGASR